VQNAAIDALFRLRSPEVFDPALEVLRYGSDYQLLRTAAMALQGIGEERRDEAATALLGALRRLTAEETDTSRDPRVAIVTRLGEVLWPVRAGELMAYTGDYDDSVRAAAQKAFAALLQAPIVYEQPKRRYPYQPTEVDLGHLPSVAQLHLGRGTVTLALDREVAPVTVARFTQLVRAGYYDGLTFHRVVPNFVVQGGSPGANEYVGAPRFMRDEPGPTSHVRGAVGISTRGWDTGDAQIFIDLVDLPRLDRDYTVFAYVTSGMEFVDRMLEGAVIKSIGLK
jgi:cyclophilin family peptidyl-prolyl cis-trans isomerase